MKFLLPSLLLLGSANALAPRNIKIQGQNFVDVNGNNVVMSGPNVVVKGPPFLPSVSGDTICDDLVNDDCKATNSCKTCYTFNQADIDHIKEVGWDTIRLGVVWAGAQPRDEDKLDPDFLERLHAILDLTDKTGINVILDNHGDMVGSAGCGNGVPMWFSQKAAPELIGKPLTTGFPYNLISSLKIENVAGYDVCGADESKWAKFAGDPNYNLLNECCQAINSPNPGATGYTKINQKAMDYMIKPGQGRDEFIRFWRLMSEAVVDHPSAIAAELMNEPMTIFRKHAFNTWKETAIVVNSIIPDMSVALADTGEAPLIPSWISKFYGFFGAALRIDSETEDWIKKTTTLFYAWHYYAAPPKDAASAIANVQAVSKAWDVPSFATEFMRCDVWEAAEAAGISRSYWHYSSYCDTRPDYFGEKVLVDETFGACILGWGGGNSHYTCDDSAVSID